MKHPMQPLLQDKHGTVRFKENKIVQYLLDNGGINLNHLARGEFSQEDWEQFAQLIGYSVSGFGDLSYAHPNTVAAANLLAEKLLDGAPIPKEQARIQSLEAELASVKWHLRNAAVAAFNIAPEDLV
jgi:hypothetical protein